MAGSRAVGDCEPGQIRKEAALSGPAHAPRISLAGAKEWRARPKGRFDDGCTVHDSHTPDPSWPEPGPFEGREAVMEFVREWVAPWESVRLELDELEERGGWVVSRCRWLTRGKASGAATVVPFTFLGAARGGHLAELRAFFDHDAALRSLD